MIHICCGHEKSIGLEVFFKSFLNLDSETTKHYLLYANLEDVKLTLISLNISYKILSSKLIDLQDKQLSIVPIEKTVELPITTLSMQKILEQIDHEKDILLTLPTSKDQLIIDNTLTAGYTEFLRKTFNLFNLSMFFSAPEDYVLLITDHIPLNKVSSIIGQDLIYEKISTTLMAHKKYFFNFDEVLLAGINPHAGENGILGSEDSVIAKAITKLKKHHTQTFIGPLPGDTLHFHNNPAKKQLKVYMFHDQGLVAFKAKNGLIGLNITLGLPFLRMSVDHGTAFELFGKNSADDSGCQYMLTTALTIHKKLNS